MIMSAMLNGDTNDTLEAPHLWRISLEHLARLEETDEHLQQNECMWSP